MKETQLNTWADVQGFIVESEKGEGDAFFLFRGVHDAAYNLESSLKVFASGKNVYGDDWQNHIEELERKLITQFLNEIEPTAELKSQYSWWDPPGQKNDTFWYLSVMQHYGCPTRFLDFTRDVWSALFFATDGIKSNTNFAIYRLKCEGDDFHGNKLPKDENGKPWQMQDGSRNINDLLGHIIGYQGFPHGGWSKSKPSSWHRPKQPFGWDTPRFKNARIQKQSGYFVYNLDVRRTLHDEVVGCAEFEKFILGPSLVLSVQNQLKQLGRANWAMYLDLDRAFENFKGREIRGGN